jgi:hypothetical protein
VEGRWWNVYPWNASYGNGAIKMLNKIDVLSYNDNGESTLDLLFINGRWFCYALEDEARDIKLAGETRIPRAMFQLGIRKEVTPLTQKYRDRFDWFEFHIEILSVPDFDYVYMHIGNDADDTEACVLVGDDANNNNHGVGYIKNSGKAFERFYKLVYPKLKAGETFLIELQDINLNVHRGE